MLIGNAWTAGETVRLVSQPTLSLSPALDTSLDCHPGESGDPFFNRRLWTLAARPRGSTGSP